MHKIASFGLLVILLAACSGQSGVDRLVATNPEAYESGQQVYAQYCIACHGVNGDGQFPDAPLQKDETGRYGAPPHNEAGHTWHHDDDLLYQIVREGGMGNPEDFYPMPPFGELLSDVDIESVLFYIKTLWTEEQRTTQAERTRLIREQSD